jgi:ABC-2 type transport system permease protein/lipopolysaccharide transport system permease protein
MNKAYIDLQKGLSLYKVWIYQAYHELSKKYQHTILGSLWIAGSMVTTSLCLAIVFGAIQGQNLFQTLPYIMGGILVWSLVGFILSEANEVFLGAGGIIKNHAYPFTYYMLEAVTRQFLTFLHNLVVFFLTLFCIGYFRVPNFELLLALPIVLVTMTSWGVVVAMLSARFRDLRFMIPYISQLVFFITPIFWQPSSTVHGWRLSLVNYNPFYGLIEVIREPLLGNQPSSVCWVQAIGAMVSGLVVWAIVFSVFRRRIPFWV